MLVDPDGLVLVCVICGAIGFAIGWCGGAVDAIQRRREFDKEQRALGVAGLVDCGACRTQGCPAGKCRNVGAKGPDHG